MASSLARPMSAAPRSRRPSSRVRCRAPQRSPTNPSRSRVRVAVPRLDAEISSELREQPRRDGGFAPAPARLGGLSRTVTLGAPLGAVGIISSMSAYFAIVFRLTPSLLAISARGTLPASIDRISFIMSKGTVISSVLPGRAWQSLHPGTQYVEGRSPLIPGGAALVIILLNSQCPRRSRSGTIRATF